VYNRLQGLAAVVAAGSDVKTVLASFGEDTGRSPLPYDARKAEWTQRPDLLALSRQLLVATEDIGVDIMWLLNAGGDCVAASNSAEPMSFIGTNYADRTYFSSAQAGKRGRQYAVGRVTKVPGLFFSAPVMADGRFLGAVAVKSDLSRIATAVNHPYAFVTDDQGVIILAANHSLEMRAVPGAAVHQMPAELRQARYLRQEFPTYDTGTDRGRDGLLAVTGSPHPHIVARSELPQHGITTHILLPLEGIENLRGDALVVFLLLACSGTLLVALVFGARAYVVRVRHQQAIMTTANEALDRLAKTDPLTGCANRRHFLARLDSELGRAGRYGHECGLLAIDIDLFKQVNDRHGHAAGDVALRHVVKVANKQLRGEDELGRIGGEEFAVLLPETGRASAIVVAERIRHAIETTPSRFNGLQIPLTASFGVACWKSPSESAEALLQRADSALYAAKKNGRNRLVVCGEGAQTTRARSPDPAI
jgi:diguanylate cyclase (GGDEF)-like protein